MYVIEMDLISTKRRRIFLKQLQGIRGSLGSIPIGGRGHFLQHIFPSQGNIF